MNVHFIDDGDASARDVQMLFKVYIAKADDLEAQQNIVKDFEAAWTKGEANNIGDVITAHEPRFLTMNRTFKPPRVQCFAGNDLLGIAIRVYGRHWTVEVRYMQVRPMVAETTGFKHKPPVLHF